MGEPLDKNMAAAKVLSDLAWHDARQLPLEGRGWEDVDRHYSRLPRRAEALVPPKVWRLAQHSAGLCVRFATEATHIAARWTLLNPGLAMPHMAATGVSGLDLYTRHEGSWRWIGVGKPVDSPTNTVVLAEHLSTGEREYLLYLPLYNGVEQLEIGLPPTSSFLPGPPYIGNVARPICVYGTSIVQGGCASRPGMAYPAILGRRLNRPILNLGFSGNGKMEPEVASLLAELDPAIFVIDCLPNVEEPMVTERLIPLVHTLRDAHATTPIVLVESAPYQNGYLNEGRQKRYHRSNAALRSSHALMLAEGEKRLYIVPGENLLGSDGESTADGGHPTDVGFLRMVDVIEPSLHLAIGSTTPSLQD